MDTGAAATSGARPSARVRAGISSALEQQPGTLFRGQLGTTPARYMEQERLEHARMLLDSGYSVTSAARHSGSGTDENLHRETRETAPSNRPVLDRPPGRLSATLPA